MKKRLSTVKVCAWCGAIELAPEVWQTAVKAEEHPLGVPSHGLCPNCYQHLEALGSLPLPALANGSGANTPNSGPRPHLATKTPRRRGP
ncbi:MAG: hypothetical protein ACFCBW_12325 [Candidatus Competibacterales bacterium]